MKLLLADGLMERLGLSELITVRCFGKSIMHIKVELQRFVWPQVVNLYAQVVWKVILECLRSDPVNLYHI